MSRACSGVGVQVITPDASGDAYEPPDASASDPYFKLPLSYWSGPERYYRTLDLPAKAMLLVTLSPQRRRG